jgi:hypothetical protein
MPLPPRLIATSLAKTVKQAVDIIKPHRMEGAPSSACLTNDAGIRHFGLTKL